MRRQFGLGTALALALAVAPALLGGSAARAADLTVGAFGGVWEQSLRRCVIEPFQKRTGKTVDVVLGAPVQWLNQIAASPGKPPLDVIYNPTETSFDAIDRKLVEQFPADRVPNVRELVPRFAEIGGGYGVVHNFGAMGLMYNKETVKEPPKTWKAMVDGILAGKYRVSIPNINYPSGGLTISVWRFAELYGGGVDNIKPGIDIVKRMRDSGNLTFWTDPNQVLGALKSGDVDMAMYWDGRAWSFIDDGNKEFGYYNPEDGSVVAMTWIQKVRGGSDLGWDFINTALSREAQSCFGSAIRYGVGHANPNFDPKVAHQITRIDQIVYPPFRDIPSRQNSWIETWNKEIGR